MQKAVLVIFKEHCQGIMLFKTVASVGQENRKGKDQPEARGQGLSFDWDWFALVSAALWDFQDFSSPTRDWAKAPAGKTGVRSPNHRMTREIPWLKWWTIFCFYVYIHLCIFYKKGLIKSSSSDKDQIFMPKSKCVLSQFSHVQLCNSWTVAHQAPLSMGFPR